MLPETIVNYLKNAAQEARTQLPDREASLFRAGVLDSFSLVDFVTLIEKEYGITIDDNDLRPENFDTIAKIETFIDKVGVSR